MTALGGLAGPLWGRSGGAWGRWRSPGAGWGPRGRLGSPGAAQGRVGPGGARVTYDCARGRSEAALGGLRLEARGWRGLRPLRL